MNRILRLVLVHRNLYVIFMHVRTCKKKKKGRGKKSRLSGKYNRVMSLIIFAFFISEFINVLGYLFLAVAPDVHRSLNTSNRNAVLQPPPHPTSATILISNNIFYLL